MKRINIKQIIEKRDQNELLNSEDVTNLYNFALESDKNMCYLLDKAKLIREENYGNNIEIYVPIYISNICQNDCLYCDFRKSNTNITRKSLNEAEYAKEIEYLVKKGHRFIEIVGGEGKIENYVNKIKLTKKIIGETVNSTIAVFPGVYEIEKLVKLKTAGAEIFICWQESFNKNDYEKLHTGGSVKNDFEKRYNIQGMAIKAGIEKTGIGFLAGLSDHRSEVNELIKSGNHLIEEFALEPYIIGTPRFTGVKSAPLSEAPHKVTDEQLLLQVAISRIAFPHSYIMLSTREDMNLLIMMIDAGANLINAEASTTPGGYTGNSNSDTQFNHYSYNLESIKDKLINHGLKPICEMNRSPKLQEIVYRKLDSISDNNGNIVEFRTKETEKYMLAKRFKQNDPIGNNYHKGLFLSKRPETVVLLTGKLLIKTQHVENRTEKEIVIEAKEHPVKITVPTFVYHRVYVEEDSTLLEFSSLEEDSLDSFQL